MVQPWIVAEDFNDIMSITEKRGGGQLAYANVHYLKREWMPVIFWIWDLLGLNILGKDLFISERQRILERLDRALCNENCRLDFLDGYIRV